MDAGQSEGPTRPGSTCCGAWQGVELPRTTCRTRRTKDEDRTGGPGVGGAQRREKPGSGAGTAARGAASPGLGDGEQAGLGPWPLPNHPGWPAAARTAPRAPRCTPGASFPHVRRCSLTLSCLYSWMKKGGDRTRPVSVPPLVTAKPRRSTSTPSRHISRWCYFVSLNMCLLISIHNDYVYQLLNFERVN